jgi:hypothetical protein
MENRYDNFGMLSSKSEASEQLTAKVCKSE